MLKSQAFQNKWDKIQFTEHSIRAGNQGQKQRELSNDAILKSSAQVKELGSRYAIAYGDSKANAQLKELGTTYAIGLENEIIHKTQKHPKQ